MLRQPAQHELRLTQRAAIEGKDPSMGEVHGRWLSEARQDFVLLVLFLFTFELSFCTLRLLGVSDTACYYAAATPLATEPRLRIPHDH